MTFENRRLRAVGTLREGPYRESKDERAETAGIAV
jgi:hypothetical protein